MNGLQQRVRNKRSNYAGTKTVFRNEKGAIDLASIMVGIIVIGLIGGVIAATVFAVIPWAQDNAAKQQLDAIVASQSAYMGLSSGVPPAVPTGHPANSYGDSSALQSANLLKANSKDYCVVITEEGKGYQAFSKSSSGAYWSVTHSNTKPVEIEYSSLPDNCYHLLAPTDDPTPKLTQLTYLCDAPTTISLPIKDRDAGGVITWSDGTKETTPAGTAPITKTLSAGVTYTASFEGTYKIFSSGFAGESGNSCLRSLDHWGQETGITNASNAFHLNPNLVDVPARLPSTITNTSYMFASATSFNDADVSKWDTSNINDMSGTFNNAKSFNQSLNNWDTSKVSTMRSMFSGADKFNKPLNNWDTSKLTDMYYMFYRAAEFNQNIERWDVSKVTDLTYTFAAASKFNQPLNNWNISSVTTLSNTFLSASSFNQPLNDWNVSNVTSLRSTFRETSFNHPLDKWNVAKVTNMHQVFYNTKAFNQPLNSWNVSKVENMSGMFAQAAAFNQPLDKWTVTKVQDMSGMFSDNGAFIQDLSNWNTASLTSSELFAIPSFPDKYLPPKVVKNNTNNE